MTGHLKVYGTYSFVDKDPVIDRMRTLVKREGLTHQQIAEKSGVAATTLYNWFEGNTKRPQYATVMAVVSALGYKHSFVKRGS